MAMMNHYMESFGDSCLVIHDTAEFEHRLMSCIQKNYPEFDGVGCRVAYSKQPHHQGILFTKPREFMHQREYRFSWHSATKAIPIEYDIIMQEDKEKIEKMMPPPIHVNIGSLRDIAEIAYKK